MVYMRQRNTGSFDRSTKTWRLRTKGIQISLSQLSEKYGVTFDRNISVAERQSAPYWNRHRQEVEDTRQQSEIETKPFAGRIQSLKAMIAHIKGEDRLRDDLERLEAELRYLLELKPPTEDQDSEYFAIADLPVFHPDIQARADAMGLGFEQTLMLCATEPKHLTKIIHDSIRNEADNFIERIKARSISSRAHYQPRRAIDLLMRCTGDISVRDITVHHWREFQTQINQQTKWSDRTKYNIDRLARSFLQKVEADHNLRYGFLANKDYKRECPDGQKEQYKRDQLENALKEATGNIRLALLLGLNCGMYESDMQHLKPEMFDGTYITAPRAKLRHHKYKMIGIWRLWDETKKHLTFNLNWKNLIMRYNRWAKQHQLPTHKALRKTTAQIIEDDINDSKAARLFRCEKLPGCHGKNYIVSFTPRQKARLEQALIKVAKIYGIS